MVTINAGPRFDHSRTVSQDLTALDSQGRDTNGLVRGLGTLYAWNVWSQRLGTTVKLTADGRTMLRGSYGRFNQGVLTGELGRFHPATTPITTVAFDPVTGGCTTIVAAEKRHSDQWQAFASYTVIAIVALVLEATALSRVTTTAAAGSS
jgi:hypothetical protein